MPTRYSLILAALLLGGCSLNSPLPAHQPVLPGQWSSQTQTPDWPDSHYWQAFGADTLLRLQQQARQHNHDLAAAAARLQQADAQLRQAGAALLPSLDAGLNAGRSGNDNGVGNNLSASLGASYEVDFWGRNHQLREAARASLDASHFDQATLAVAIEASVANSWFQLLETLEREQLAQQNLHSAERLLQLVEARAAAGAADALEVSQQRILVLQQRAALLPLQQQRLALHNSLNLLLGNTPDAALPVDSALASLHVPEASAGLPSELLQQRPDIRASEARLLAANADLNAARAALWPSLRLTGQYAGQSSTLADLLGNPATSWNLLGGLTQPIFDGSRLRARVEQADARQQELLIDYQRSILTAISEADTALAAALSSRQRVQQQQHVVEQAQLALQLAEARYRAGAIALSTLLDSQRSLFQSQDALLQLLSAQLQTAVDLYRALGGGWQATALSYSD